MSAPACIADSGSAGMEVEVRAPRLVDQQRDVVLVRDRRDRFEVGGDAVVRGRHDVDRLDVGFARDRRPHRLRRDRVVHVQRLVDLGLHPHRHRARHDEPAHRALVRVARQRELVARVERRHHHALVAAGGAVDQEERVLRAEALRGEVLRFDQRLFGLQQVVEPADLGEVDGQDVVADEVAERALHPDPLLVAGRVERDDARVDVVEQDLEVRCARLVERRRRGLPEVHNASEYSTLATRALSSIRTRRRASVRRRPGRPGGGRAGRRRSSRAPQCRRRTRCAPRTPRG